MIVALLAFSVVPLVFAEDAGDDGGIDVIIENPDNECPEIYQDATQRSWYPNDQTIYTAEEYGNCDTNLYGDEVCEVEARGNYVFAGETVTYYVIVSDSNGASDIEDVYLSGLGGCVEISAPTEGFPTGYSNWADYASAKFGVAWDASDMNLYKCKVIVPAGATSYPTVTVVAEDEDDEECHVTDEKELITFNPELGVDLDGSIAFGSLTPGSTGMSNPVKIQNLIMGADGVVMDMYLASDDYFTSDDEKAVCGDGNGIKYDQFSYYATKGSLDSGDNNNAYPGLGETSGICVADADEYTSMPSHSGQIKDMCRIINHLETGSFLTQGDYMSIKFAVDIPDNCSPASYVNGQFHVIGRVV